MYGVERYGEMQYAATGKDTDAEEYYIDLMHLVPEFIWRKLEMYEIYKTQGYEVGYLQHALEDVINQCFITTATWGLDRWEKIFALDTNLSLTYEQRREIIMAKLRGQGTTTKQMIKETAAAFSGGEVEVIEDNPASRFIVRFVGIKGIPRNMQAFISMLKEIKPAHLAHEFEYRYTVWGELKPMRWGDVRGKTWDEVRVMEVTR